MSILLNIGREVKILGTDIEGVIVDIYDDIFHIEHKNASGATVRDTFARSLVVPASANITSGGSEIGVAASAATSPVVVSGGAEGNALAPVSVAEVLAGASQTGAVTTEGNAESTGASGSASGAIATPTPDANSPKSSASAGGAPVAGTAGAAAVDQAAQQNAQAATSTMNGGDE